MRENQMVFSNTLASHVTRAVTSSGVTSFARQMLSNTGPGGAPSHNGACWFSQL